jgi:hypothetical protein
LEIKRWRGFADLPFFIMECAAARLGGKLPRGSRDPDVNSSENRTTFLRLLQMLTFEIVISDALRQSAAAFFNKE